jgi:hypothetical protein
VVVRGTVKMGKSLITKAIQAGEGTEIEDTAATITMGTLATIIIIDGIEEERIISQ